MLCTRVQKSYLHKPLLQALEQQNFFLLKVTYKIHRANAAVMNSLTTSIGKNYYRVISKIPYMQPRQKIDFFSKVTLTTICHVNNSQKHADDATATFATAILPLVPAGYIQVNLNCTTVKVPYYAV